MARASQDSAALGAACGRVWGVMRKALGDLSHKPNCIVSMLLQRLDAFISIKTSLATRRADESEEKRWTILRVGDDTRPVCVSRMHDSPQCHDDDESHDDSVRVSDSVCVQKRRTW